MSLQYIPDYPDYFESFKNQRLQIDGIGTTTVPAAALHVHRSIRELMACAHYCEYKHIPPSGIRALAAYWEALSKWQGEVEAAGFDRAVVIANNHQEATNGNDQH